MHRALRQLEHDVTALRPGKSIRLMCHCAPKRCHAHVIAHEIQRRLRTRDIHILVEDGGWGRTEVLYEDDDRGDDDMSTNCEDGGNAETGVPDDGHEGEAAGARGADIHADGHTGVPESPNHTNSDTAQEPSTMIELGSTAYSNLLHRLRDERVGGSADTDAAETGVGGHAGALKEPDCAQTDAARGPSALIEKLRIRHNRLRNKRAFEEFMRTYTCPDVVHARPHPSLPALRKQDPETRDNPGTGTDRAQRQKTTHSEEEDDKQAHSADSEARGDGGGADGTRATQRVTRDGGTTGGIKKRGQHSREAKARRGKRSGHDKYSDRAP